MECRRCAIRGYCLEYVHQYRRQLWRQPLFLHATGRNVWHSDLFFPWQLRRTLWKRLQRRHMGYHELERVERNWRKRQSRLIMCATCHRTTCLRRGGQRCRALGDLLQRQRLGPMVKDRHRYLHRQSRLHQHWGKQGSVRRGGRQRQSLQQHRTVTGSGRPMVLDSRFSGITFLLDVARPG